MKASRLAGILAILSSLSYLTMAQMPDFFSTISVDSKKAFSNVTKIFSDICDVNKVKLDRQAMERHIENCVKPQIDQILAIGNEGSAGPMVRQLMTAIQTQPIKFTPEQRSWIKSRIIAPACKIFPCVNPLKNPLMEQCMSGGNVLGVKKGFQFTDMYLDAVCKDDGEILFALAEAVNRECAQEYAKKFETCIKKEAELFNDDRGLNKTVAETCRILGKLNTCQISSIRTCGAKATELYQTAFGNIETWIKTACLDDTNAGSQFKPMWSFLAIILYLLL